MIIDYRRAKERNRRLKKLSEMVRKYKDGTLDFVPICPISTYDLQIRTMTDYVAIHEARAVMEDVELPVVNKWVKS